MNILHPRSDAERLLAAPRAFTTRRVPPEEIRCLLRDTRRPCAGDLILARIESLGHHRRLHLPDGRQRRIFVGDEVIIAYANRYASRQFEAVVPDTFERCHLVAAGGVAATALSWPERVWRGPTVVMPIGFLSNAPNGEPINVADWGLPKTSLLPQYGPPVIAVVGTAMHSGKTTVAACLVRGLRRIRRRVGFAKVTGTGAAGDFFMLRDAGANPVLDFTDAGYASTYRVVLSEIEGIFKQLVAHLQRENVDAIVLEVADGLLQPETSALIASNAFRSLVSGLIFTASDAMGAAFGAERLRYLGLKLLTISGVLTSSPLQVREASEATGLPVIGCDRFLVPTEVRMLLDSASNRKTEG
jgi:hypothetical protein